MRRVFCAAHLPGGCGANGFINSWHASTMSEPETVQIDDRRFSSTFVFFDGLGHRGGLGDVREQLLCRQIHALQQYDNQMKAMSGQRLSFLRRVNGSETVRTSPRTCGDETSTICWVTSRHLLDTSRPSAAHSYCAPITDRSESSGAAEAHATFH